MKLREAGAWHPWLAALLALRVAGPLAPADSVPAGAVAGSPPASAHAWQTGALRPDRLQHASLAFSLGLAAGVATRSPGAAAGSAIALGLAKELADRRHAGFDAGDLIADALGAACAAFAVSGLGR